jgi:hypothetical protein
MHPTHPRRRPWPSVLLLVVTALLVALAAVVVVAPPAGAHSLGGVEPSNYQTRVLAVRPPLPGVSVEVVDGGTRLRLVNTSGRDVVVLGYRSEPWLRVGPGGVFENSLSPTVGMTGPLDPTGPAAAAPDPGAPVRWRKVEEGPAVAWHDHRAHWEAEEPPTQVRRAPGSGHLVIPRWTVKLRTSSRLADVVGEVRWVPGPSPLPWLAGAALLAMAVVAVARTRRWTAALVASMGLVVALDLLQLAGAWAGAQVPLAGKLLSLGASAAGWMMAGLAVRQLLRRRFESGLFQLLLAAGLLIVVGGLGDLGFLLRSQLASSLPDTMVRAAVAAKIGLSAGALTAAALDLHALLRFRAELAEGMGRVQDGGREDRDPGPLEARFDEGTMVPELHVVGGRARRRDRAPAAAGSTLATVLPWPGARRPDIDEMDDPDLPGGA